MRKFLKISIFCIFCIIIASCGTFKHNLEPKYCPEPQVICSPIGYTGIPRDTSAMVAQIQGWHYRVEEVSQINSAGDEWAVAFDGPTPYLTVSDADRNSILECKYISFNKIIPQKTIQYRTEGSLGFPAFTKNKSLVSFQKSYQNSKENELTDSAGRVLVPLHESIGQSRIFTGKFNDNYIIDSDPLDFNNAQTTEWYSHPAITPDGKILFFASDRAGSIGGVDIWMAYYDGLSISEPINCGSKINTECDEITPYVSPDGKSLYFSSCGGETVGGYDIFRADISELVKSSKFKSAEEIEQMNVFGSRENIREPFNTQFNEMSPNCRGNCDSLLYYASNQNRVRSDRYDKGGFDIFVRYKVHVKKEKIKKEISEPTIAIERVERTDIAAPKTDWFFKLEGTIYAKSNKTPLENADVIAEETSGNQKNKVKTNSSGKYSIPMIKNEEYLVTATSKDLFPQNIKIFVSSDDTIKIVNRDFYLPDKYTLRVNFPTDIYDAPYRYVLDSSGFETGVLWQEDLTALAENIIASQESILKIVLVGHTDDVASIEYNQKLGERRVNFVIDELVRRGVPRELLEGKSAGELELLPAISGEQLDLYRKRCRRVILEKVLK